VGLVVLKKRYSGSNEAVIFGGSFTSGLIKGRGLTAPPIA
jgi:hypothetical protein